MQKAKSFNYKNSKAKTKTQEESEIEYHFSLFIVGNELNSSIAKKNLNIFCKNHLEDNYKIEIINILNNYKKALQYKIFITPALVIKRNHSSMVIYGNLNETDKMLSILDIKGD